MGMHHAKGEDGPEEMWQPFMREIANLSLEASKDSKRVVLSDATPRQAMREFVVKLWIDGGANPDKISVMHLTIDPDVRLRDLFRREKEKIEEAGLSMEEYMQMKGWEGEGEPTEDDFVEFNKKDQEPEEIPAFQDVPDGYQHLKKLHLTGRDMAALDDVDEALGLAGKRNDQTLTFEKIRDTVKVYDARRDKVFVKNLEEIPELAKLLEDAAAAGIDDDDES